MRRRERERLREALETLETCDDALAALRWHQATVERARAAAARRFSETRSRPRHRAHTV